MRNLSRPLHTAPDMQSAGVLRRGGSGRAPVSRVEFAVIGTGFALPRDADRRSAFQAVPALRLGWRYAVLRPCGPQCRPGGRRSRPLNHAAGQPDAVSAYGTSASPHGDAPTGMRATTSSVSVSSTVTSFDGPFAV